MIKKARRAGSTGVSSPEQSVPKRHKGRGVEGTDENEQQKVETHHDGKVVPKKPRAAAGTPVEQREEQQTQNDGSAFSVIIFDKL